MVIIIFCNTDRRLSVAVYFVYKVIIIIFTGHQPGQAHLTQLRASAGWIKTPVAKQAPEGLKRTLIKCMCKSLDCFYSIV